MLPTKTCAHCCDVKTACRQDALIAYFKSGSSQLDFRGWCELELRPVPRPILARPVRRRPKVRRLAPDQRQSTTRRPDQRQPDQRQSTNRRPEQRQPTPRGPGLRRLSDKVYLNGAAVRQGASPVESSNLKRQYRITCFLLTVSFDSATREMLLYSQNDCNSKGCRNSLNSVLSPTAACEGAGTRVGPGPCCRLLVASNKGEKTENLPVLFRRTCDHQNHVGARDARAPSISSNKQNTCEISVFFCFLQQPVEKPIEPLDLFTVANSLWNRMQVVRLGLHLNVDSHVVSAQINSHPSEINLAAYNVLEKWRGQQGCPVEARRVLKESLRVCELEEIVHRLG